MSGDAVSNIGGSVVVSGTAQTMSCVPFTVGGTLSQCAQTALNLSIGASTTSEYGIRDLPSNSVIVTGGTRDDGTTIAWDVRPVTAPITYAVGDSFANGGVTHTGFINNTAIARIERTTHVWSVDAIDDVQTPAGWFECYVVTRTITEFDLLTGVATTGVATSYVRPEIGVVFSTLSITATDGVEIVTTTLTLTATTITP